MSRAEQAYNLRISSNPPVPWKEVAETLAYPNGRSAMKVAKSYAFRRGLNWPPPSFSIDGEGGTHPRDPKGEDVRSQWWQEGTLGERAYFLREREELTWSEIGLRFSAPSSVSTLALRYARSRGLKWPLLSRAQKVLSRVQKDNQNLGVLAYELRVREKFEWEEISSSLGIPQERARKLAHTYAKKNDLPAIPPSPTRYERFGPICYELRSQGKTWNKVAEESGIKWNTHACTAAHKHAEKNNLPWPPEGELIEFVQSGSFRNSVCEVTVVKPLNIVNIREEALLEKQRKALEPRVAFLVLMVEHEWGQRDEGWRMFPSQAQALEYKKENEGPGAPGQYFSYEGPYIYHVTAEVWDLLHMHPGSTFGEGRHLPPEGHLITVEDIRVPVRVST